MLRMTPKQKEVFLAGYYSLTHKGDETMTNAEAKAIDELLRALPEIDRDMSKINSDSCRLLTNQDAERIRAFLDGVRVVRMMAIVTLEDAVKG